MAILSKGNTFATGDQVTALKLNNLVDSATFASGAVDDSTTQLDGSGRIIVKDGGITTAKLNLSATGVSQTIASFKTVQDAQNRSLDIKTPASTTDLNSPFELSTGNAILFQIDPDHSILFDSDGKVGIGTTTPTATLHVVDQGTTGPCILTQTASASEGDIAVIDGEALQIGHWNGSDTFTNRVEITSDGTVRIKGQTSDGDANLQLISTSGSDTSKLGFGDNGDADVGGITYNHSDDSMRFATNTSEHVRINTDGKVGIGTTSPTATLHVVDQGSTQPCIFVQGASPSEGDIAVLDGEALQIGHWNNSDTFTERMRIDDAGAVLIGRTSSSSGSEDNGVVLSPSGFMIVARDGTSSQSHMEFINNAAVTATVVGSISTSGSATAFNTSSDYRLKEDILEMQDSIERVKALKPVNFAWKLDGSRVDGFLAHEAQEVVPEAVTGTKDAMKTEEYEVTPQVLDEEGNVVTEAVMGTREVEDYQGIDQSKLVPLLTKALQEALTKIESLEARVAALES
tara:strand:- start:773 stop:2320 length:1548 start_codon:yes stop_codon:yes gene_type:complete